MNAWVISGKIERPGSLDFLAIRKGALSGVMGGSTGWRISASECTNVTDHGPTSRIWGCNFFISGSSGRLVQLWRMSSGVMLGSVTQYEYARFFVRRPLEITSWSERASLLRQSHVLSGLRMSAETE